MGEPLRQASVLAWFCWRRDRSMSARQAYKREPGKAVAEPGRSAELQMSTKSTVPCAEGLWLKQQYESAVQLWREYTLPPQKQVVVAISTLQASRQEALAKR